MTDRKTLDELMEGRQLRRMKQEDHFLARQEARAATALRDALPLIGELCREGQTIFYVNAKRGPVEFATRDDAIDYLTI